MSTTLKKKEKFLRDICFLIVYLVPLTMLFYGGTIYPYIIPRALAFIFLIDLLVVFYGLLVKLNPEYQPRFQSPILQAIIIYLAVLLLTSIFGQNFQKSFWGSLEYVDGLMFLFHLLIFLIILLALFREKKQWLILLEISVFASFLASLIGLQELVKTKIITGRWVRIESIFGNPLYFAHFLLFNLFFSFFLLIEYVRQRFVNISFFSKKFLLKVFTWRNWRFFYYFFLISLELFLLLTTKTRGGFLGLTIGLLSMVVVSFVVYKNKIFRLIVLCLVMTALILGTSLVVNLDRWQLLQIGLPRGLIDFSLTVDSSFFRRLLVWEAGLKAYPQHWLFGWGWNNFDYAYLTNFPPQLMEDEGAEIWFKHAHNIVVEHLVNGGLIGVAAYIFLIVAILINWFKVFNKKIISSFFLIVIIGLISADFIFNLFAFYSIASYILFFITLGLLIFQEQSSQSKLISYQTTLQYRQTAMGRGLVYGGFLFAIISLIFYVKPTWSISRKLNLAVNLEKKEKIAAATEFYQSAAEKRCWTQAEGVLLFDRFLNKWGVNFKDGERTDYYQKAIQLTEPFIKNEPYNLLLTNELLFLYKANFSLQNDYIFKTQELVNQTKIIFPLHPLVYYHSGAVLLAQKTPELALGEFQQAINLDPKISQSYWLALKPAVILGKLDLVDKYLAKIESIEHPNPLGNPAGYTSSISSRPKRMRELAETFTQVGLYKRAIKTLEDLLNLEEIFVLPFYKVKSQKIETLAQLAPLYAILGQNEKAEEIAHQLLLLDFNLEEQINNFLKELESGSLRKIPSQ